jgi:hypothetical protein
MNSFKPITKGTIPLSHIQSRQGIRHDIKTGSVNLSKQWASNARKNATKKNT